MRLGDRAAMSRASVLIAPDEIAEAQAQHAAQDKRKKRTARRKARRERLTQVAVPVTSTAFELAGLGGVAVGLYQLAAWLGITVGSLGLIVVGVAIDPPNIRWPKRTASSDQATSE